MDLLKDVINTLLTEKPLDPKYFDHALVGNYAGFRERHIELDWLLIYFINNGTLTLTAARVLTVMSSENILAYWVKYKCR